MKVEFSADEAWQMMDSVVDQLLAEDLGRKDRATLRRWRTEEMSAGSPSMRLLAEKINAELQRDHARAESSPIKKPDWMQ